jgi:hypothetical protein
MVEAPGLVKCKKLKISAVNRVRSNLETAFCRFNNDKLVARKLQNAVPNIGSKYPNHISQNGGGAGIVR